jgi:DNA-binding response OmpR family regulator
MRTVLIVDDEESIRSLYALELTAEGYAVVTAADAEEALERIAASRPDLVTVDVRLPGMDGITLARKIKDVDRTIPVVLVSAYEHYKEQFAAWAADAYVVKSSDTRELKETVRRMLEQ